MLSEEPCSGMCCCSLSRGAVESSRAEQPDHTKAYLLTSKANLQGNSEINFTNQRKDQKSDQKEMQ